jgi:hypothetical protein
MAGRLSPAGVILSERPEVGCESKDLLLVISYSEGREERPSFYRSRKVGQKCSLS